MIVFVSTRLVERFFLQCSIVLFIPNLVKPSVNSVEDVELFIERNRESINDIWSSVLLCTRRDWEQGRWTFYCTKCFDYDRGKKYNHMDFVSISFLLVKSKICTVVTQKGLSNGSLHLTRWPCSNYQGAKLNTRFDKDRLNTAAQKFW